MIQPSRLFRERIFNFSGTKIDKNRKIISLQDLADLAGVSRATASRALNDSPLISEKTKSKVRHLADRHDYVLNTRARDFRLQRTGVIAVVFMLDLQSKQRMSDPFFLDMLGGIADSLAEHDYDLLLAHAPIANVLNLKNSRFVTQSEGIIFIGQAEQHSHLNKLATKNPNIVVWGHPVEGKKYTVVGGNNELGGYLATKHLLDAGRKEVAFLGSIDNPENAARYQGFLRAHKESDIDAIEELRLDIPFEMKSARNSLIELMENGVPMDAAVCATDVMALAAISTFLELGVRVPEDVAIVGYDDIGLAEYSNPALTTINQNIRWAGKVLVESLLGIIGGEAVPDTCLNTNLVVRKSSQAPSNPS